MNITGDAVYKTYLNIEVSFGVFSISTLETLYKIITLAEKNKQVNIYL